MELNVNECMVKTIPRNSQPVVQENDFPIKNERIEVLASQYQTKNPGATETTIARKKYEPTVTMGVKAQLFETLNENQQKEVMSRIEGIDYMVSNDILTYGSLKNNLITKQAEEIIRKNSSNDLGGLNSQITQLVTTIRRNTPTRKVEKVYFSNKPKIGIVEAIREYISLSRARKELAKQLNGHENVMQSIQSVRVMLEKQKIGLIRDVASYEKMKVETGSQVDSLGLDIIGMQMLVEKAQKELAVISSGEMDILEATKANDIQAAIDRMQRRIETLSTLRIVSIQNIPQLMLLINGDELLCEKIDEIENLVVPMWEQQYALAIGIIRQQEAIALQKAIRSITAQIFRGNAEQLHDNIVSIYNELNAAYVAAEDFLLVQGYISDMVEKVGESAKKVKVRSLEELKTMQAVEEQNHKFLTA